MKIVQLIIAPNDALWQGILLGLGDDGNVYKAGGCGWEPEIECKVKTLQAPHPHKLAFAVRSHLDDYAELQDCPEDGPSVSLLIAKLRAALRDYDQSLKPAAVSRDDTEGGAQ